MSQTVQDPSPTVTLTSWDQVREALRSKHLRQAGYTEGAVVMAGTLLDLHGDEHRQRRRIENRLFRRETFARWENETLRSTIDATLRPFVNPVRQGSADLVQIGYRAAMNLTAQIAGIDVDPADADRTDQLYGIVKTFSEGATLMHSTRDKDLVRAEVRDAAAAFRTDFYLDSFNRRAALLQETEAGGNDDQTLPQDVLTTLLQNSDRLPLDDETLFREICFYLQAGAHSTANALVHTTDAILGWCEQTDAAPASLNLAFTQRCMHESLRLHPASPVAYRTPLQDVVLSDGTTLAAGATVVLDLMAANRDRRIFGDSASAFDPNRVVPSGVPAWGMSFGGGTHACIGAELDGGLQAGSSPLESQHLFGTVAVVVHALLAAGVSPDPTQPPTSDPNSTRKHFNTYPVQFPTSTLLAGGLGDDLRSGAPEGECHD